MTDKELLEEIKKELELDWSDISYVVNQDDVKWLINRVEELEEHVKDLKIMLKVLGRQTERYKQALEFYADEENYCVRFEDDYEPILQDNGKTAREALEGEE